MSNETKYPSWWPQNPYPESVFPMPIENYSQIVPEPHIRTALSGTLGRQFWNMASEAILEVLQEQLFNDHKAQIILERNERIDELFRENEQLKEQLSTSYICGCGDTCECPGCQGKAGE